MKLTINKVEVEVKQFMGVGPLIVATPQGEVKANAGDYIFTWPGGEKSVLSEQVAESLMTAEEKKKADEDAAHEVAVREAEKAGISVEEWVARETARIQDLREKLKTDEEQKKDKQEAENNLEEAKKKLEEETKKLREEEKKVAAKNAEEAAKKQSPFAPAPVAKENPLAGRPLEEKDKDEFGFPVGVNPPRSESAPPSNPAPPNPPPPGK